MILVNGEKFKDEEFHNGEVILETPGVIKEDKNIIELFFQNNKDIATLTFLRHWLMDKHPEAECELVMKYCPYERMDREINQQMFSMRYFAEIIADLKFSKVSILDAHSRVCVEEMQKLGVNVDELNLEDYINKVIELFQPDYICYPDKGAYNKYPNVLNNIKLPYFYGNKVRDLANKGHITEYKLVNAPDLTDKKILIIDDICCLGGTAYNAATEMKLRGAKEVAFYISHCENGIFVGKILKREPFHPNNYGEGLPWAGGYTIDKVYTADTMKLSNWHDNITKIEV